MGYDHIGGAVYGRRLGTNFLHAMYLQEKHLYHLQSKYFFSDKFFLNQNMMLRRRTYGELYNQHLHIQSLQRKQQSNMWKLLEVFDKGNKTVSLKSVWCCCYHCTDFKYCSSVSIVAFEQFIVGCEYSLMNNIAA